MNLDGGSCAAKTSASIRHDRTTKLACAGVGLRVTRSASRVVLRKYGALPKKKKKKKKKRAPQGSPAEQQSCIVIQIRTSLARHVGERVC
jgi:hypothetical protein